MSRVIKRILQRYYTWWSTSGLSIKWKVHYFTHHIIAYLRLILTNKRYVNYLGRRINYDNKIVPYWLLAYPSETLKLFRNIEGEVKSFLDIGGNIGQTSLTVFPLTSIDHIDIFEPNGDIFPLLEENVSSIEGVRAFKYGIGKDRKEEFFYIPGQSGSGSLIEDIDKKKSVDRFSKIDVELVSDIQKITGRSFYDIVKIDVEGYEYDVIDCMEGVKFKYLFIEITGPKRVQTYKYSQLMNRIAQKFGDFDLVFQDDLDKEKLATELLLRFYP